MSCTKRILYAGWDFMKNWKKRIKNVTNGLVLHYMYIAETFNTLQNLADICACIRSCGKFMQKYSVLFIED